MCGWTTTTLVVREFVSFGISFQEKIHKITFFSLSLLHEPSTNSLTNTGAATTLLAFSKSVHTHNLNSAMGAHSNTHSEEGEKAEPRSTRDAHSERNFGMESVHVSGTMYTRY